MREFAPLLHKVAFSVAEEVGAVGLLAFELGGVGIRRPGWCAERNDRRAERGGGGHRRR